MALPNKVRGHQRGDSSRGLFRWQRKFYGLESIRVCIWRMLRFTGDARTADRRCILDETVYSPAEGHKVVQCAFEAKRYEPGCECIIYRVAIYVFSPMGVMSVWCYGYCRYQYGCLLICTWHYSSCIARQYTTYCNVLINIVRIGATYVIRSPLILVL